MVDAPHDWPKPGEIPPCPEATRREVARDVATFLWELLRDFGEDRPRWRRAVAFALLPFVPVLFAATWIALVAIVGVGGLVGFGLVLPVLTFRELWRQVAQSTQECKRIRWDAEHQTAAMRAAAWQTHLPDASIRPGLGRELKRVDTLDDAVEFMGPGTTTGPRRDH